MVEILKSYNPAAANATDYGLGAVVFGKKDADMVAGRLQAGMVGINTGAGGDRRTDTGSLHNQK